MTTDTHFHHVDTLTCGGMIAEISQDWSIRDTGYQVTLFYDYYMSDGDNYVIDEAIIPDYIEMAVRAHFRVQQLKAQDLLHRWYVDVSATIVKVLP